MSPTSRLGVVNSILSNLELFAVLSNSINFFLYNLFLISMKKALLIIYKSYLD